MSYEIEKFASKNHVQTEKEYKTFIYSTLIGDRLCAKIERQNPMTEQKVQCVGVLDNASFLCYFMISLEMRDTFFELKWQTCFSIVVM